MWPAFEKQQADPPVGPDTKGFARQQRSTQQEQRGRPVAEMHDKWSWARNGLRKGATPVAIAKLRRCYAPKGWFSSSIGSTATRAYCFFGAVGILSDAMAGSTLEGLVPPSRS